MTESKEMLDDNDNDARLRRLIELLKERDKIMTTEWNNMFRGEG